MAALSPCALVEQKLRPMVMSIVEVQRSPIEARKPKSAFCMVVIAKRWFKRGRLYFKKPQLSLMLPLDDIRVIWLRQASTVGPPFGMSNTKPVLAFAPADPTGDPPPLSFQLRDVQRSLPSDCVDSAMWHLLLPHDCRTSSLAPSAKSWC